MRRATVSATATWMRNWRSPPRIRNPRTIASTVVRRTANSAAAFADRDGSGGPGLAISFLNEFFHCAKFDLQALVVLRAGDLLASPRSEREGHYHALGPLEPTHGGLEVVHDVAPHVLR